jgi:uncharacterized protein YndB with AHSA1/START domain
MPVRKEPSGRRSVQAEVEVPGTPEEVWQAIATGPGISSWFVPSEVEEREGGKAVSHFAPDDSMDSVGTITAWEPPHRFLMETAELSEGAQPVATEWTVEARDGGTCVVRVVHAWFASTDDWDTQFEQHEIGWGIFFRILRLYLAHFRGQPCAAFQLMGTASEPQAAAWATVAGPLGLLGAEKGQQTASSDAAPALAGHVEDAGPPEYPTVMLRLESPAPGLAHFFAMPMGGQVLLPIRFFLYGEGAADTARQIEPVWQAWLNERLAPAAAGAS